MRCELRLKGSSNLLGSTVISCSLSRFATLLHQCLTSVKKGSAKEVGLASHAIGSTLAFLILPLAFRSSFKIWLIIIYFSFFCRTFSSDHWSWGESSRDLGRIIFPYIRSS